MSEELLQRDLVKNPEKIGKWDFYNIGATSLKALKDHSIIPKKDYKSFEKRKPDALVVDNKRVVAVVENKLPSEFKTTQQKEKAFRQGIEVAEKLDAKVLILTDTIETIWINVAKEEVITDESGNQLKAVFNPKSADIAKLLEHIIESVDTKNSQLRQPILKDPTKLAKSVWQDLWSVSGATPENCLYTFVELFIFKYLSDLGILKGRMSYEFLMREFENTDEQQTLEYYAENIRNHIKKKLFPVSGKDNTTIINGTIFVSKDDNAVEGYGAVFKKILQKFGDENQGGGELKNIDHDFKSKLFETFLKESISKKNWGQFFTPLKVVRAIVKMAQSDIRENMTICDPACGVGKFLLESILNDVSKFYKVKDGKLESKINLLGIDKGFDRDEQKTIILAKANMLIYMSDLIRKNTEITDQFSNLFNNTFQLKTKNILGTLRDPVVEEIDLILTNPPYVTSGSSNLKEEIIRSGIQSHYKINALGVEGLFMEWIIRALKPNGKAFVIVPDGIFNRISDKHLRKFITDECFIDAVISLPLNTFFTTNKKTFILAVTKKEDKSVKQVNPVFTYLVSEIGETLDINRFDIQENHLDDAAELFNQFKSSNKSKFKVNDLRCKIFDFKQFEDNIEITWIIDRWWTQEEKIELGIAETINKMSVAEYSVFLGDIANTLSTLQEQLNELTEKKDTEKSLTFKSFKIEEIFDLSTTTNSSKFTKDFINQHKGSVPVYSASKNHGSVDYGYVADKLEGVKYFNDCLTWNIDGSIGKAHYREGRFSLSEKVIPLILKSKDNVDISYIKQEIEGEFGKHSFGFGNKAGKGRIKDIEIKIPVDEKGSFDLSAQLEISRKAKAIDSIKFEISKNMEEAISKKIDLK